MGNTSFSRARSLNWLFLVGVSSVCVVTAPALFGWQTERKLTGDHAHGPDSQIYHLTKVPSGYIAGVRQAWVASYTGVFDDEPIGMVVDNSGNTYVTGRTSIPDYSAYVTVKYDARGQEEWSVGYNPPNCISSAAAIAVDHSGNVYVTGTSETFAFGDSDYVTIKYNNSGQQQWLVRYDGGENFDDRASAIAVDGSENVYVTGSSGVSADYATIKYNDSGQQQWVSRYTAQGSPVAIAVDKPGSVYITGSSAGDYATIKYDNSGQQQWVARYSGGDPVAMRVDEAGSVYVTGSSAGDYVTIKYDASGQEQWLARYNGSENGDDEAAGLSIDNHHNVYVTGTSSGPGGISSYATVKYDSVGQQQWLSRYQSPENLGDMATAIAVSSSGNVYVTGMSWASATASDYATVKYNSSGQEQWVARYNGPQGYDDYARAIAVDRRENVFVTGASRQNAVQYDWDFATIKYMPDRIPQPQPRP